PASVETEGSLCARALLHRGLPQGRIAHGGGDELVHARSQERGGRRRHERPGEHYYASRPSGGRTATHIIAYEKNCGRGHAALIGPVSSKRPPPCSIQVTGTDVPRAERL